MEIQKLLDGIGIYYKNHKDNTIIYQVNKASDINNVIIPFLIKYQLRSDKLRSFIYFKYIVETIIKREHINNYTTLLTLVSVAHNMNPLSKKGNAIRYLNKDEENMILSNELFIKVKHDHLDKMLNSFKSNPLTIEFICGLIDGAGNISLYFEDNKDILRPRFNFTLVQDSHNVPLLEEIQAFFNIGSIYTLNINCSIYKTSSLIDLYHIILPMFLDNKDKDKDNDNKNNDNNDIVINPNKYLPIIQRNKFIYSYLILKIVLNKNEFNDKDLYRIIKYSYYVSEEYNNITLNQYINNLVKKDI